MSTVKSKNIKKWKGTTKWHPAMQPLRECLIKKTPNTYTDFEHSNFSPDVWFTWFIYVLNTSLTNDHRIYYLNIFLIIICLIYIIIPYSTISEQIAPGVCIKIMNQRGCRRSEKSYPFYMYLCIFTYSILYILSSYSFLSIFCCPSWELAQASPRSFSPGCFFTQILILLILVWCAPFCTPALLPPFLHLFFH